MVLPIPPRASLSPGTANGSSQGLPPMPCTWASLLRPLLNLASVRLYALAVCLPHASRTLFLDRLPVREVTHNLHRSRELVFRISPAHIMTTSLHPSVPGERLKSSKVRWPLLTPTFHSYHIPLAQLPALGTFFTGFQVLGLCQPPLQLQGLRSLL